MRRIFCLFVVVCSSLLAFATQPWDGPALSADPAAIRQAADAIPKPAAANAQVLFHQERYTYDAQGRGVEVYQVVYRVLTSAGVEGWSSVEATWAPWYQKRPEVRVRVINPDGSVHPLEPSAIAESPVTDEDQDIYSDERQLRAPLPAVVPGSIIEEEVVTTDTAPFFDAGSVEEMYFGYSVPSVLSRLIVDVPAGTPLQYKPFLIKNLSIQELSKDGRKVVTFESAAMDAIDEPEPGRPGDVPGWPQVRFSTAASWQAVATRYNAIVEEKLAGIDVSSYVAALKAKKLDRAALIQAVVEQLHKDVRYTGIEFGQSSIVPHTPTEVLHSHYGDCKDKSTLLVAMLRSVGVPAYVALLHAGPAFDVSPELPGFGMFDHAIVYVPSPTPGPGDIWIDATDEFARIDALHPNDQGRMALIVRPETTGLTATSELPSSADFMVERREYYLAEQGPSRVVEISEPRGPIEADYRGWYGGADTKDVHKRLEDYVKSTYLAEKLSKLEHTSGDDMGKPFRLTLEAEKARRAYVTEDEATVYIPLGNIYDRLPEFIRNAPQRDSNHKVSDDDKRKNDAVIRNFVTEWQIKVVPPAGFSPRPLPPDSKLQIGPAVLSAHYQVGEGGAVNAVFRFDSTRGRWTAAEVESARDAIRELDRADSPAIHFDLSASAELQRGNVRKALGEYRALIALHPSEALHHSQLSRGLLEAGVGDAARDEARRATQLEPKSARAWANLAWVLQFDSIGRRFGKGWDMAGADAAYQKAIALDPDLTVAAGNYGILLERDARGRHYTDKARLAKAIDVYKSIHDKLPDIGLDDNLVFALFFAERYQDCLDELKKLDSSEARRELLVASTAALSGPAAAADEAGRQVAGQEQRSKLLRDAADLMLAQRRYPLAADLVTESARGQQDPATLLANANNLRKTQPVEKQLYPVSDPRRIVQEMMTFTLGMGDGQWTRFASRHIQKHAASKQDLEQAEHVRYHTYQQLTNGRLPLEVVVDMALSNITMTADGSADIGYRVRLQSTNGVDETFYVVAEDGGFRVVGSTEDMVGIPAYALWRVEQGDVAGARRWLDWQREVVKPAGGDDPLAGPALPRFWTRGQDGDANAVRLACAAALAGSDYNDEATRILTAARATAPDAQKMFIDIALVRAYAKDHRYAEVRDLARKLADANPDSILALNVLAAADRALGSSDDVQQLLDARLKRLPGDPETIRALVEVAAGRGDFKQAAAYSKQIIDAGRATAADLNQYSWYLLVGDLQLDEAERAAELARQRNAKDPNLLHTLAALYAENGKTREAREILLEAMDEWGLEEPNGASWYVLGRIAEQYGLNDVATAAYQRVDKPEETWMESTASWGLAQRRLAAMKSAARPTQRAAK